MVAYQKLSKNVYYSKDFTFHFENKNWLCQQNIKFSLLFSQLRIYRLKPARTDNLNPDDIVWGPAGEAG